MTNQKGIATVPVIAIVFAILALSVAGYMFYGTYNNNHRPVKKNYPNDLVMSRQECMAQNGDTWPLSGEYLPVITTDNFIAQISDKDFVPSVCLRIDATNQNTNTNTTVNNNTNTPPETLPAGVKRFTSKTLGITFTYLETAKNYKATVSEIGDKVYIAVNLRTDESITTGQWVQVMSKDAGDTLTQAIEKRFLTGIDPVKCFVKILPRDYGSYYTGLPSTISLATISFPINNSNDDPWWNQKDCPAGYSASNGVSFFWMDSAHPDKLLFFSIGQYGINGLNDNYKTTWDKTVRVTETSPTAGWKTYTNATYHFSFKYPAQWELDVRTYDPSSDNPFSSDYVLVKDKTDASVSFLVCPDARGSDCPPFQDSEWNSSTSNVTVGGVAGVETTYTPAAGQQCSTCTPRSTITLNDRPTGWAGGRDFLLEPGKNASTIPDLILSTFTFTK